MLTGLYYKQQISLDETEVTIADQGGLATVQLLTAGDYEITARGCNGKNGGCSQGK